jgi:hypothetical protein
MTMALFQSFWLDSAIPHNQRLCMTSFIDHGHAFDLYSYGAPAVPAGVRLLDAAEILPRNEVFFYRRGASVGSVAGFANMFRYRLLMLRGGWWVDTDVVCLSPQVPDDALFLEREDDTTIGNAVMKFPQGHAFVGALYEASRAAGQDIAFGQTGPALITKLAQQQGMWDRAGAPSSAYPVHYDDAFLPVTVSGREATRERTRSAAFLHLWNEVFRRAGSMALHNPPNRSFLADLYRKHRVHRRFWSVIDRHKVLTIRHAVRVRLRDAVGGR